MLLIAGFCLTDASDCRGSTQSLNRGFCKACSCLQPFKKSWSIHLSLKMLATQHSENENFS